MRCLLAGVLFAVTLGACAATRSAPPEVAPFTPVGRTAEEIISATTARRQSLRSLRALARVAYTSPEESRKVKQILVAERPDRLRLEVFSPWGLLFVLSATGEHLSAFDPRKNVLYRGAATPANLERYVSVDVSLPAAIDLLFGTPALAVSETANVTEQNGNLILWQSVDGATHSVTLTPSLDPVRVDHWDANGRLRLQVAYEPFSVHDGVRVPTRLVFLLPETERRVEIELSDTEVNPLLPKTAFAIEAPPGTRVTHFP